MKYEALINKQNKLEAIKIQLKKEFFGIDHVIEQVIDTISPWYLFNEIQESPLVVNLWGLTGTGKTALVKRLVELLEKKQGFFHFDMNELPRKSINRELTTAQKVYEEDDYIICLDEFQHAKSIDEEQKEVMSKSEFNVWNFLDTGEFDFESYGYGYNNSNFMSKYHNLSTWIDYGFKIQNGKVELKQQPQNLEKYIKYYFDLKEEKESVIFLDTSTRVKISKLFPERFKNTIEFDEYYFKCDEHEILQLLYASSRRKKEKEKGQMKNALVFVLGNLDEAYKMSHNFNPDISADSFYKLSLRININHIKNALKNRFRNEQIARLGNNHIIYPALSEDAFTSIIQVKLDAITKKFKSNTGIDLRFTNSVFSMLFENGVYPTQGVRPLLSSIKSYIDAKLGTILTYMINNEVEADEVEIDVRKQQLLVTYFRNKEEVDFYKVKIDLPLEKIREKKDINKKAVTAVHEAGHAVISILLQNEIPTLLNANSTDVSAYGFMFSDEEKNTIAKKDLVDLAALYLGGLEAEALVFGEDHITLGANSDYSEATEVISEALKQNGMSKLLGFHKKISLQNPHALESKLPQVEEEIIQLLHEAKLKAKQVLTNEKKLLLNIAVHLFGNNSMHKKDLEVMIEDYALGIDLRKIKAKQEEKFYVTQLEKAINQLPKDNVSIERQLTDSLYNFCNLNKHKVE